MSEDYIYLDINKLKKYFDSISDMKFVILDRVRDIIDSDNDYYSHVKSTMVFYGYSHEWDETEIYKKVTDYIIKMLNDRKTHPEYNTVKDKIGVYTIHLQKTQLMKQQPNWEDAIIIWFRYCIPRNATEENKLEVEQINKELQ